MSKARSLTEVEKVFWPKVNMGKEDECWPWTGYVQNKGYGIISMMGKKTRASCAAWILANKKPIPNGLFICHKCDNPICCNPNHLFAATRAENVIDMILKGRHPRISRFSQDGLVGIRIKYTLHGLDMPDLAREYNCGTSTICRIINFRGCYGEKRKENIRKFITKFGLPVKQQTRKENVSCSQQY